MPAPAKPLSASEAIEAFLRALGHDPATNPALRGTGARVEALYREQLLDGYRNDLDGLFADTIPVGPGAPLVVAARLPTHVVCPHHLTLGEGHTDVAYFPSDRVLGLGAVGALVDTLTHRLVLQEDVCRDVARVLVERLGARGAACRMTLRHGCLTHHPPKKRGALVTTIALAGSCERSDADLALVIAALGRDRAQAKAKVTLKAPRGGS